MVILSSGLQMIPLNHDKMDQMYLKLLDCADSVVACMGTSTLVLVLNYT